MSEHASEPVSGTVDAPGAVLHYDVRSGDGPVLLIIGSPMGAGGFATLAGHFPDRTVVTYDPRGAGRSKRTDGALVSTVEEHADDLRRLTEAVTDGPADIFATSGGAVNALALTARYPATVQTLVAHEPPAFAELPDAKTALSVAADIRQTYERSGFGPAMAKFIALAMWPGPLPEDYLSRPAPDPDAFGLPATDDGSRDDPLVGLNMPSCVAYRHDFGALRAARARVIIGVSEDSPSAIAGRCAVAVAARLGLAPVTFPGGHDGFSGGEYGPPGKPDAFAATLREVLSQG